MVTFIASSDTWSKGTPESWAEAVLAAKHGDPNSVVMLSIYDPQCTWPEDRICKLVKEFPYYWIGDINADDLSPDFAKATELVDVACANFIPQ